MGTVFSKVDLKEFQEMTAEVEKYYEDESHLAENLGNSTAFSLVYAAKRYDDWFGDPFLGFVLPGIGDILSSLAVMPALYVAIFKLKSFVLSFAILSITALDVIAGAVPVVGDIVDAFHKSNKKAARWIVGYIENDPDTISEVRTAATWGTIGAIVLGFLVWSIYSAVIAAWHWLFS